MAIAEHIESRLLCGDKTADRNVKNTSDDDDVIEPDIDVGSYDDIVDEAESIKCEVESIKCEPNSILCKSFLIEHILQKK